MYEARSITLLRKAHPYLVLHKGSGPGPQLCGKALHGSCRALCPCRQLQASVHTTSAIHFQIPAAHSQYETALTQGAVVASLMSSGRPQVDFLQCSRERKRGCMRPPLKGIQQPVLCGPVRKQDCQDGQASRADARLAAQQGSGNGAPSIEGDIGCRKTHISHPICAACFSIQQPHAKTSIKALTGS